MNASIVFREIFHDVDVCVVGGGMAGLTAALAAARHGARVILMHDRPVLGGNASSECRVHICGADRHNQVKNLRETGILEELRLNNLRGNPNRNFSVWDTVLYEAVRLQPNLTLLLNCSCLDAQMEAPADTGDGHLVSITGWQLTTQTHHRVHAKIFVDASGDAILGPLTGATCRTGREARSEYGESIAPEKADLRTMGMTCLFQAREYPTPQPFTPPSWARRFERCEELPYGPGGHNWIPMGYWWIELGGEHDSIHDTEQLRDELLRVTYGVWDHIKNHCQKKDAAACWALDWIQFLPAKRESRRYIGDHVLNQCDVDTEGRFEDIVAYGGWTMDDHHPAGFEAVRLGAPATIFHPSPSPFGIPYRALYSRNVSNLMFAGRDASCTHAAMSSTRVMGTGCSMGQAVGTAAALAARKGLCPRDVGRHMHELQQSLLADDAYLPWVVQEMPSLTREAKLTASQGNPEPVRDGINRPVGGNLHAWTAQPGDTLAYVFSSPRNVSQATLILDSALEKTIQMSQHQRDDQLDSLPDTLPHTFHLEGLEGDRWTALHTVSDNAQRPVRIPVQRRLSGIRWTLDTTRGAPSSRVFAFYVE